MVLVRALLEASCPFQRARLHESVVFGLMKEDISFRPFFMLRIRRSRYQLPRCIGNLKFSGSKLAVVSLNSTGKTPHFSILTCIQKVAQTTAEGAQQHKAKYPRMEAKLLLGGHSANLQFAEQQPDAPGD